MGANQEVDQGAAWLGARIPTQEVGGSKVDRGNDPGGRVERQSWGRKHPISMAQYSAASRGVANFGLKRQQPPTIIRSEAAEDGKSS
jgi:hypothetical protein